MAPPAALQPRGKFYLLLLPLLPGRRRHWKETETAAGTYLQRPLMLKYI